MVLIARVSGLCNVRRNTGAGIKASATGKSADKASVDGNLEDAAELEKPFLVAGVADAAAYEDRAEESFGEDAAGGVAGKLGSGEGIAVHFADFGKSGEVDLFADKLRERENFVEVAGAADEILVADQFVEAVGAEASEAAEDVIQAIDRAGVGIFVDLEIGLGGVDVGSEKPAAEWPEGAVEFGGDAVGGAEFQVGAPFGTIAPDVHRGEAGAHGEVDVLRGAANYFDVKQ